MRLPVLLFLVGIGVSAFGQNQKIHSLQRKLNSMKPDTLRVQLLNDIAYEYWSTNPDKTREYALQGLQLSKELKYLAGQARSYQCLGIYYWKTDQHVEALTQYEQARKLYDEIGDRAGVAKCLANLGLVYKDQGNDALALKKYFEALNLIQQLGDEQTEANTLNSIGVLYKNRGNLTEAITYFNQALEKWRQLNMTQNIAGGLNNLANVFSRQQEYDKALDYNRQSLKLFESLSDLNGQIICHNNMGDFMVRKAQPDSALMHYRAAMRLNGTYRHKKWLASSHNGLGAAYQQLKNVPSAIAHYDSAYYLAQNIGLNAALEEAAAGLASLYATSRNYDKAFFYQQRYSTLKDSLFAKENSMQLANLRAGYEVERKQIEIKLLQQEKELAQATRNALAIGLASLLIMAVLLLRQQQIKAKKNQELMAKSRELHEAQQALAEAERSASLLREQQLQEELEFRNKSLTTHTLNLIQKNGIMEEIRETVSNVLSSTPRNETSPVYGRLIKLIDYSFSLDKDWDDFRMYFEQVHKDFFIRLKERNPDLTNNELKLAALVRLNLSLKETATIMGISPDSVKTSRYRLRKKLNLEEEINLTDYLTNLTLQ
jgi:tetratricopeptide (TPR) repeat protein